MHELIAERYERAATILTSNLDFGEWGDAFAANRMLGAATLDRLRHGAYRVVLDGDSYRAPRNPPEASKSPVAKAPQKAAILSPTRDPFQAIRTGAITAIIDGAISPVGDS